MSRRTSDFSLVSGSTTAPDPAAPRSAAVFQGHAVGLRDFHVNLGIQALEAAQGLPAAGSCPEGADAKFHLSGLQFLHVLYNILHLPVIYQHFPGPLQHDLPGLGGADARGGADEACPLLRLHTLEGLAQADYKQFFGDRVVMITEEELKVKRIRNTPRVTLAVCDMRGNVMGEPVEAVATVDDSHTEAVYRAINKRYGIVGRIFSLFSKLRGGAGRTVGLEIRPA